MQFLGAVYYFIFRQRFSPGLCCFGFSLFLLLLRLWCVSVCSDYIFIECFWFATVSRTHGNAFRIVQSSLIYTLFLWNYFDLNCRNSIVCHFLCVAVRGLCVVVVSVCPLCATFTIDFYVFIYSIEQFILFFFSPVGSSVEPPYSFIRRFLFLYVCLMLFLLFFRHFTAIFPTFVLFKWIFPCWGLFPQPGVLSI